MVDRWRGVADKHGVIVVGPDGLGGGWDLSRDGPRFLNAVFTDVGKLYPIDRRRVYLFGHSVGGAFTINVGLLGSESFAAAALHAGKFRSRVQFRMLDKVQRKIPFAFFIGSRDHLFPLHKVKRSADAIAKAGHPVEFYLLSGHTHWYYDIAGFINERAWRFFEKHQLPEPATQPEAPPPPKG